MKPQDLFDYAVRAKEANPNILKSMAENIENNAKPKILPLVVNKNGTYDNPVTEDIRTEIFKFDDPRGIPCFDKFNSILFVIPMTLPQTITSENILDIFSEKKINIGVKNADGFELNIDKTILPMVLPQIIEIPNLGVDFGLFSVVTSLRTFCKEAYPAADASLVPDEPGLSLSSDPGTDFNVTYLKDYIPYDGYLPVEVNVQANIKPLTITKNGIYNGAEVRTVVDKFTKDTEGTVELGGLSNVFVYPYNYSLPNPITQESLRQVFIDGLSIKVNFTVDGEPNVYTLDASNYDKEVADQRIFFEGGAAIANYGIIFISSMTAILPSVPDAPGIICPVYEDNTDLEYEITYLKQENVDGYLPIEVSIEGKGKIEALNVTENGTYTPPIGTDGYSPVTVDVEAAKPQLPLYPAEYKTYSAKDLFIPTILSSNDLPKVETLTDNDIYHITVHYSVLGDDYCRVGDLNVEDLFNYADNSFSPDMVTSSKLELHSLEKKNGQNFYFVSSGTPVFYSFDKEYVPGQAHSQCGSVILISKSAIYDYNLHVVNKATQIDKPLPGIYVSVNRLNQIANINYLDLDPARAEKEYSIGEVIPEIPNLDISFPKKPDGSSYFNADTTFRLIIQKMYAPSDIKNAERKELTIDNGTSKINYIYFPLRNSGYSSNINRSGLILNMVQLYNRQLMNTYFPEVLAAINNCTSKDYDELGYAIPQNTTLEENIVILSTKYNQTLKEVKKDGTLQDPPIGFYIKAETTINDMLYIPYQETDITITI